MRVILPTNQLSGHAGAVQLDEHRSIERFNRTLAAEWAYAETYHLPRLDPHL